MLEAFSEQPLPVANRQVLAPLTPGPIEIILEVNGVEAERHTLSLPAGRIVDLKFDTLGQAVAHAVSIDLELEFVRQGRGQPVSGLQVDWLGGRMQRSAITDARGRVRFRALDRQKAHEFTLHAPATGPGLPEWPERTPLRIGQDELAGTGTPAETVRRRIELTPLRWLLARLPGETATAVRNRRSPYPVYVLQRNLESGWVDSAAAHFIATADGLAVSIAEPGTYRVAAVLSPWRVLESTAARIDDGTVQRRVDLPGARGRDVVVTILRDGRPLAGAPVAIIGPIGRLPPEVLTADGAGRITLASATVPWVRVEVPGSDQVEVRLEGPQALADFGLDRTP